MLTYVHVKRFYPLFKNVSIYLTVKRFRRSYIFLPSSVHVTENSNLETAASERVLRIKNTYVPAKWITIIYDIIYIHFTVFFRIESRVERTFVHGRDKQYLYRFNCEIIAINAEICYSCSFTS